MTQLAGIYIPTPKYQLTRAGHLSGLDTHRDNLGVSVVRNAACSVRWHSLRGNPCAARALLVHCASDH